MAWSGGRSREDRRVVHVDLTDSGRRLLTDAPQVAQGLLVEGLEVLTGAELQSSASGWAAREDTGRPEAAAAVHALSPRRQHGEKENSQGQGQQGEMKNRPLVVHAAASAYSARLLRPGWAHERKPQA